MNTFWRIFWRVLAALVLLAAVAGIAFYAYEAGLTQAGAPNAQPNGTGAVLPNWHYWHPFARYGMGPVFGCLIPLFLLFLVLGSIRALVGPRPWGWHHMHHRHWYGHDQDEKFVPPMFAEWHRRVHGESEQEKKS